MSNELVASQVTDEHIEFIVTCLAHFYTTDEVLDRFALEFGKHIDRKTCNKLNPQLKSSRNLDSKWVDLFHVERAGYVEQEQHIPIANRAVRLRRYEEEYHDAEDTNTRLKILEQAAKEVGGLYTNKTEIKQELESDTISKLMDELHNEK